ncbi:MAG: DNA cytosine methyltransferase [Amaricoccus sp.]|uniref:DNA cytosine methyltransferase n=1 Tax=Amaricoccus sp. TaxID=1872485 RepID=UPI0039E708FF
MTDNVHDEIIVDSFAGGGGASTGIELALGRSPDVAINHDANAIALHRANHPETVHLTTDIWGVDPAAVAAGRKIGLLWASPTCTHFSKAKGAALVDRNIRDLSWVVCRWAELPRATKPRVIILENVEEFRGWGPVGEDGRPVKEFCGVTYEAWIKRLNAAGYKVQWRELRACDYGAPTIRKRLFVIARSDGNPIVWPKPTHGDPKSDAVKRGKLLAWRTAAECIDWSLPCPSIFETPAEIMAKHGLRAKRPLADATLRRIARGIMRYVVDSPRPFIVSVAHGDSGGRRDYPIDEPLGTQTSGGRQHAIVTPIISYAQQGGGNRPADAPLHTLCASPKDQNTLVAATMVQTGYGERPGQAPRSLEIEAPIGTQVAGGSKHAVVATFLAQHNAGPRNGGISGREVDAPISTVTAAGAQQQVVAASLMNLRGTNKTCAAVDEPARTVTAGGNHAGLIAAHITRQFGNSIGSTVDDPVGTITAGGAGKAGLVAAFLTKYYGTGDGARLDEPMHTDTTRDRMGLVTIEIDGATYAIVDIGMRMLTPWERFLAQGFPADYAIEEGIGADGEPVRLTLDAQGRACGNSVCPPLASALVAANCADLAFQAEREVV